MCQIFHAAFPAHKKGLRTRKPKTATETLKKTQFN